MNEGRYDGTSPLYEAVDNNDRETVKLLMKYGADVNMEKDGISPIDLAGKKQYLIILGILKDK